MKTFEDPQLVEAVLLWTGWGRDDTPRRDTTSLTDYFGAATAAKLLAVLKALENEFYSSNARFVAVDLEDMANVAAKDFRRSHPGIAEEIVKAFAWCYTFDFK